MSAGSLTWRDLFHKTKTEIVISLSPWIHSQSGWKSAPCPLYTVGGRPSSYTMTWLPIGANHIMLGLTMALSLRAALHSCAKLLVSVHHHITIGNSKANGQVERTIRMLKDSIRCGLTKMPTTFWMNHLAPALLPLCMTASRMMGIMPFLLVTGQQPLLPSIAIPGLPSLPDQPTLDKEETYLAKVTRIMERLQELGDARIKEAE